MSIAVIILCLVLMAIAVRKSFILSIPIWLIMTIGAILVLVLQQISISEAVNAINYDVMLYLFGVFIISQAAETSGYLGALTDRLFFKAKTGNQVLLIIIFVLGLSSALLMNDTIAIVGTPLILQLCKFNKRLVKPLLLGLAYAITVGSVLSPRESSKFADRSEGKHGDAFYRFYKTIGDTYLDNSHHCISLRLSIL